MKLTVTKLLVPMLALAIGLPNGACGDDGAGRRDTTDATHSANFHQLECLYVDKGVTVREVAAAMRQTRAAKQKILAVLGPAVVHTGGVEHLTALIQMGYIQVIFAGNALATHDIEQSFFGTSLGISMDKGVPTEEGHEHHLRAINKIRRAGGIQPAVEKGILKSGIMYESVKNHVDYVLAGSVRDDGPLTDVVTDAVVAQGLMRQHVRNGVGFCLMVATALHSIATGNLLPAWVKVACIDLGSFRPCALPPRLIAELADDE